MYITEDSSSSLVLIDLYVNEKDLNRLLTLDVALKYASDDKDYMQYTHQLYTCQSNLALLYNDSGNLHTFKVVYEHSCYILQLTDNTEPYLPANCEASNREKRDNLLAKTDWTDNSSVLSAKCQQSMRGYRQLLRDLFEIMDVQKSIIFPSEPALEFNYPSVTTTTYTTDLEAIFQVVTVDKEYQGKYNLFLQEWRNLNSTTNVIVVNTLLDTYCPELKQSIIEHLTK